MSLELAFAGMCELVGADVLEGLERTRTAVLLITSALLTIWVRPNGVTSRTATLSP